MPRAHLEEVPALEAGVLSGLLGQAVRGSRRQTRISAFWPEPSVIDDVDTRWDSRPTRTRRR